MRNEERWAIAERYLQAAKDEVRGDGLGHPLGIQAKSRPDTPSPSPHSSNLGIVIEWF
jgi:hypothetical protein